MLLPPTVAEMWPLASTPDQDEARRLLEEELARPEYSPELNPVTRFIRDILDWITGAFGEEARSLPLEYVLLGGTTIIVALVALTVALNPVRLSSRKQSTALFEDTSLTLSQVHDHYLVARKEGDLSASVIWGFRLLVLSLDADGTIHDSPGLTAREAATIAGKVRPDLAPALEATAEVFNDVRYGDLPATTDHVEAIETLLHRRASLVGRPSS